LHYIALHCQKESRMHTSAAPPSPAPSPSRHNVELALHFHLHLAFHLTVFPSQPDVCCLSPCIYIYS
jgi:hypothetical protein